MAIITRLVQGKKNPNRVNLYLDGEFSFTLSIDEVPKNGLKKGLELTESQISELIENDNNDKVYAKILNFISYRPRTIKEVKDRLYQYEVVDPVKQLPIINKLIERGYLDDLVFAKWFIGSRNTHRPRSPRMLSQELMSKGVDREIIKSVLNEINKEEDTILRLLKKKLGDSHVLDAPKRQKITSYLGRLGFSWGVIKEVVKRWESE